MISTRRFRRLVLDMAHELARRFRKSVATGLRPGTFSALSTTARRALATAATILFKWLQPPSVKRSALIPGFR